MNHLDVRVPSVQARKEATLRRRLLQDAERRKDRAVRRLQVCSSATARARSSS